MSIHTDEPAINRNGDYSMSSAASDARVNAILIDVARYDCTIDDEVSGALSTLSEQEWANLLIASSTHRILANLARIVGGMHNAPGYVTDYCKYQLRYLRRESHVGGSESDAVIAKLAESGILAIALKGYVLARQCYETPWLRRVGDLDLLVPPGQIAAVAEVLTGLGYSQSEFTLDGGAADLSESRLRGYKEELQHLGEFTKMADDGPLLSIDVHFRLSTIFDESAPNMEVFFGNAIQLPGRQYRQFAPEYLVCHLAYHAWWDTQSIANVSAKRDLRLSQYADILVAFRTWGLDCDTILKCAKAADVYDATNWALWLTSSLFGELPGSTSIVESEAQKFDAKFADRWIQKSTTSPIGNWATPAPERMFDSRRISQSQEMLVKWIDSHTKRGDSLSWIKRDA